MNVLGIDTSTPASAVCVVREDGECFEHEPAAAALEQAPAHSRDLLAAVAHCLDRAGLAYPDIGAVAVGTGPGAFTGLRIGVVTARALARAHGAQLRPVSSLAALAAGIDAPVALPLIDAGRGEVFAALYEDGTRVVDPFAGTPELVAQRALAGGATPTAAGSGSVRFRQVLETSAIRVAPEGARAHVVRGLAICRLGAETPAAAPETVLPDYRRLPDAKPRP